MIRPQRLTVGSLFAGIGGFDLGFERAGFEIKWQVEIDPFCRAVLEQHWPTVRRYDDVRLVGAMYETEGDGLTRWALEGVDVVCGGFPCQPFSSASRGRRRGSGDHRYLWPDMCRIIRELRPAWVVIENVVHLDGAALEEVVSDLEASNYEVAPPLEIPACAFGFDHWRSRLWLLGHANGNREPGVSLNAKVAGLSKSRHDTRGVGTAYGLSRGLDARRMAALGNSIVPQIAQWIAERILKAEQEIELGSPA